MQIIKIYQTADNSKVLDFPIKSPSRKETDPDFPWLQPGYYFWEHYIEDAEQWGRIRYNNEYSIYSASYKMDDDFCLDLVSNYRHKDLFFNIRKKIHKEEEVTIEKIIKWILDNNPGIFKCVRLQSKPFHSGKIEIPTPNQNKVIFYPTTVQVCFYEFPNGLITEPFKLEKKGPKPPVFG